MKNTLRKPLIGDSTVKCICERAKRRIYCHNCGQYFKGRVRNTCREHPNVLFMMDYEYCPKCFQRQHLHEVD